MQQAGEKVLSGENVFKLYDTYGFPVDLTCEILEEKGFLLTERDLTRRWRRSEEKASARKETNYMGADATVYESIDPAVTTTFVGYDTLETASKVSVLTTESELVEALSDGEIGTVIVDETPFYATMGGQQETAA